MSSWDGPLICTMLNPKDYKKKKEIFKVEDIGCGFLSLAVVYDSDFGQIFKAIDEVELKLKATSHSHRMEWGNTDTEETNSISESELIKLEEVVGKMELCLEYSLRKIQSNLFNKPHKTTATTSLKIQEGSDLEDFPLLTDGKLKPYQLISVKWLISLWQVGLNGILADPIGIGKEIETIGFLAHLKGKGLEGPYLIITNACTLTDWVDEIRRSAPSINVIIYHGDEDSRQKIRNSFLSKTVGSKFPVIITSFWVAINDMEKYFQYYSWKCAVIDEGHWLKDKSCNIRAVFNHSRMENKLLITSTPQQNNLTELWSLLNFLLPDVFSSLEESTPWFELLGKCKVEARMELEERRVQVVAKLHSILRPFLFQRLKTEDELMLPQKELILYAGISDHQKEFQDRFVHENLEKHLLEKKRSGNKIRSSDIKHFFNSLMITLRINYNCPIALQSSDVYPPMEQLVKECGKLSLLDRLLTRLFIRNHRVIIITETSMVYRMLRSYLRKSKFEFCSIDNRKTLEQFRLGNPIKSEMEKFNDPLSNLRIVLISMQAYEMGFNFSAADTIILYGDTESSTQTDFQIIQKYQRTRQAVYIYRLATPHYVQEKDILALLEDEEKDSEKMLHRDMSDEDLERVLDRTDILAADGPCWEVVIPPISRGMHSTLRRETLELTISPTSTPPSDRTTFAEKP